MSITELPLPGLGAFVFACNATGAVAVLYSDTGSLHAWQWDDTRDAFDATGLFDGKHRFKFTGHGTAALCVTPCGNALIGNSGLEVVDEVAVRTSEVRVLIKAYVCDALAANGGVVAAYGVPRESAPAAFWEPRPVGGPCAVRLYDGATGALLCQVPRTSHMAPPRSMTLTPDGHRLLYTYGYHDRSTKVVSFDFSAPAVVTMLETELGEGGKTIGDARRCVFVSRSGVMALEDGGTCVLPTGDVYGTCNVLLAVVASTVQVWPMPPCCSVVLDKMTLATRC